MWHAICPHIDRELADRRAGIGQIEDAVARGDAAAGLTSPPCVGTCVIAISFVQAHLGGLVQQA